MVNQINQVIIIEKFLKQPGYFEAKNSNQQFYLKIYKMQFTQSQIIQIQQVLNYSNYNSQPLITTPLQELELPILHETLNRLWNFFLYNRQDNYLIGGNWGLISVKFHCRNGVILYNYYQNMKQQILSFYPDEQFELLLDFMTSVNHVDGFQKRCQLLGIHINDIMYVINKEKKVANQNMKEQNISETNQQSYPFFGESIIGNLYYTTEPGPFYEHIANTFVKQEYQEFQHNLSQPEDIIYIFSEQQQTISIKRTKKLRKRKLNFADEQEKQIVTIKVRSKRPPKKQMKKKMLEFQRKKISQPVKPKKINKKQKDKCIPVRIGRITAPVTSGYRPFLDEQQSQIVQKVQKQKKEKIPKKLMKKQKKTEIFIVDDNYISQQQIDYVEVEQINVNREKKKKRNTTNINEEYQQNNASQIMMDQYYQQSYQQTRRKKQITLKQAFKLTYTFKVFKIHKLSYKLENIQYDFDQTKLELFEEIQFENTVSSINSKKILKVFKNLIFEIFHQEKHTPNSILNYKILFKIYQIALTSDFIQMHHFQNCLQYALYYQFAKLVANIANQLCVENMLVTQGISTNIEIWRDFRFLILRRNDNNKQLTSTNCIRKFLTDMCENQTFKEFKVKQDLIFECKRMNDVYNVNCINTKYKNNKVTMLICMRIAQKIIEDLNIFHFQKANSKVKENNLSLYQKFMELNFSEIEKQEFIELILQVEQSYGCQFIIFEEYKIYFNFIKNLKESNQIANKTISNYIVGILRLYYFGEPLKDQEKYIEYKKGVARNFNREINKLLLQTFLVKIQTNYNMSIFILVGNTILEYEGFHQSWIYSQICKQIDCQKLPQQLYCQYQKLLKILIKGSINLFDKKKFQLQFQNKNNNEIRLELQFETTIYLTLEKWINSLCFKINQHVNYIQFTSDNASKSKLSNRKQVLLDIINFLFNQFSNTIEYNYIMWKLIINLKQLHFLIKNETNNVDLNEIKNTIFIKLTEFFIKPLHNIQTMMEVQNEQNNSFEITKEYIRRLRHFIFFNIKDEKSQCILRYKIKIVYSSMRDSQIQLERKYQFYGSVMGLGILAGKQNFEEISKFINNIINTTTISKYYNYKYALVFIHNVIQIMIASNLKYQQQHKRIPDKLLKEILFVIILGSLINQSYQSPCESIIQILSTYSDLQQGFCANFLRRYKNSYTKDYKKSFVNTDYSYIELNQLFTNTKEINAIITSLKSQNSISHFTAKICQLFRLLLQTEKTQLNKSIQSLNNLIKFTNLENPSSLLIYLQMNYENIQILLQLYYRIEQCQHNMYSIKQLTPSFMKYLTRKYIKHHHTQYDFRKYPIDYEITRLIAQITEEILIKIIFQMNSRQNLQISDKKKANQELIKIISKQLLSEFQSNVSQNQLIFRFLTLEFIKHTFKIYSHIIQQIIYKQWQKLIYFLKYMTGRHSLGYQWILKCRLFYYDQIYSSNESILNLLELLKTEKLISEQDYLLRVIELP